MGMSAHHILYTVRIQYLNVDIYLQIIDICKYLYPQFMNIGFYLNGVYTPWRTPIIINVL